MTFPPALVLTAGLGTRLWPLTLTRAKAAAPVADVPLIERVLGRLARFGVRDVVLNLHHRPETLTAVVGDGSHLGLRVRYSWESPILGSAGGPRHALPLMDAPRWLIVNGDTLCDLPLNGLVSRHEASGARVTLAVVPHPSPLRYGSVIVNERDEVTGFAPRGDPWAAWHFVGVQMVEASAFDSLADGQPAESVTELYPHVMAADRAALRAWRSEGHFLDIGTPRDYLAANLALAADEGRPTPLTGLRCQVAATASVQDCVLWDDVRIGAGVTLHRCIVGDGAYVPPGCRYEDAVLVPSPESFEPRSGARLESGLLVCPLAG